MNGQHVVCKKKKKKGKQSLLVGQGAKAAGKKVSVVLMMSFSSGLSLFVPVEIRSAVSVVMPN